MVIISMIIIMRWEEVAEQRICMVFKAFLVLNLDQVGKAGQISISSPTHN